MTSVRSLHDEAMKLSQLALAARHSGDKQQAEALARQALELEAHAADLVPEGKASEPTRSILYRSAASLAYQCREYEMARQLIGKALSGFPPQRVQHELEVLWEQVNFELNLQSRGIELVDETLQMQLKGNAVAFGQVLYNEFIKRVDTIFTLIERTVQRKMGREYITTGRVPQMYKPYTRVLSAMTGGSFIVNLQLGEVQGQQMSFLVDATEVISEVMTGIELLNNGEEQQLRELIPSQGYYRNFVTLAREIAPDGDQINSVSFSSKARNISLTRQRSDIQLVAIPELSEAQPKQHLIRVEGVLDYASSRRGDAIGLTTEDGTQYDILVSEGFDDLVRSYFKKVVIVTGWFDGGRINPTDMQFSDNL